MRVCVVGAGYVGAVTAACLAELGHEVVCVDVDPAKVEQLQAGGAPVHEDGLAELVARHAGSRLRATTDLAEAVLSSTVTLLSVGTPADERGIDLAAVKAATREIGNALAQSEGYHVVAVKSTVVPGTTDGVVRPLLEEASGKTAGVDFGVGTNPEFLTEGRAVVDFMEPDRIVLGALDEATHAKLEELYAPFPTAVPRLRTNTRTAEMIKYASNALLAASISFANEIANLCAAAGDVDVVDVMHGVHLSRYLTVTRPGGAPQQAQLSSYLEAGCGFGGSCLPKDVRALVAEGERLGVPMRMLTATLETNADRPQQLVGLVREALGSLAGRRILVLGLAFKPDTDDTRESPTVPVVQGLLADGAVVTVHDPVVRELPTALDLEGVELVDELEPALRESDAVVLVTRWDEYWAVPELVRRLPSPPPVIDGRRMLAKDSVPVYAGIGGGDARAVAR